MRQRKRNCPSQASCCSRYQRHSPTQSKLRILHYLPSIACLLFPRPLFAGRSSIDDWTTTIRSELLPTEMPGKRGGLNGSTQHFLEVYSQESENLKFVVGVDLSAALLCSDPTGNSRLGLRSSGSIVVRASLCFAISSPRSHVSERRRVAGSLRTCLLNAPTTSAVSLLGTLISMTKREWRSTKVAM